MKMSWHDTPLEDSTSFGANRRDGQRTLARTVLSGALVILCIAAVPALISFSGASSLRVCAEKFGHGVLLELFEEF